MESKSVLKARLVRARRNYRHFSVEYIYCQGTGSIRSRLKLAMAEKRECAVLFKRIRKVRG